MIDSKKLVIFLLLLYECRDFKKHANCRTYVVLGNKEQVDMEALKKFGKVKELTLEEIFGY